MSSIRVPYTPSLNPFSSKKNQNPQSDKRMKNNQNNNNNNKNQKTYQNKNLSAANNQKDNKNMMNIPTIPNGGPSTSVQSFYPNFEKKEKQQMEKSLLSNCPSFPSPQSMGKQTSMADKSSVCEGIIQKSLVDGKFNLLLYQQNIENAYRSRAPMLKDFNESITFGLYKTSDVGFCNYKTFALVDESIAYEDHPFVIRASDIRKYKLKICNLHPGVIIRDEKTFPQYEIKSRLSSAMKAIIPRTTFLSSLFDECDYQLHLYYRTLLSTDFDDDSNRVELDLFIVDPNNLDAQSYSNDQIKPVITTMVENNMIIHDLQLDQIPSSSKYVVEQSSQPDSRILILSAKNEIELEVQFNTNLIPTHAYSEKVTVDSTIYSKYIEYYDIINKYSPHKQFFLDEYDPSNMTNNENQMLTNESPMIENFSTIDFTMQTQISDFGQSYINEEITRNPINPDNLDLVPYGSGPADPFANVNESSDEEAHILNNSTDSSVYGDSEIIHEQIHLEVHAESAKNETTNIDSAIPKTTAETMQMIKNVVEEVKQAPLQQNQHNEPSTSQQDEPAIAKIYKTRRDYDVSPIDDPSSYEYIAALPGYIFGDLISPDEPINKDKIIQYLYDKVDFYKLYALLIGRRLKSFNKTLPYVSNYYVSLITQSILTDELILTLPDIAGEFHRRHNNTM
ncbi:P5 [Diaphorina citri reovirus]|nr:P5 [Diaphorina citri reovirus]